MSGMLSTLISPERREFDGDPTNPGELPPVTEAAKIIALAAGAQAVLAAA